MEINVFIRVLFKILLSLIVPSFGLSPLILYIYTENKNTCDEQTIIIKDLDSIGMHEFPMFYICNLDPGSVNSTYKKTVVIKA